MAEFLFQDIENIITLEYEHKYAEKVAQMWNSSDMDWPGGFTGGIQLTAKDIIEAYDNTRCAARFILYDKKKDIVVAVLEAVEIPNNKMGVYIGLNVHPSYRGAAIILLADIWTKAIDKLVEKKYRYMWMETWPTNERVIILAKRSGFYWRPNTAVSMENYFPLLMRIPIIIKFFTKYDIIECQYEQAAKRDTSIKEDKILWNNIYVYPYEWQKKKEYIRVYVDIYSHNITGVETQDFSLACYPTDNNIAYAGLNKELSWVFQNKTDRVMNVTFELMADAAIDITKEIPYKALPEMPVVEKMKWGYELRKAYSYKVEPHKEVKFSKIVKIDKYAEEINEKYYPLHRIYSNVYVDDELIKLETALKIKQPIKISHQPRYINLKPNIEKEVILNITNQMNEKLTGRLLLSSEKLEISNKILKFELKEEEKIGLPIKIKAPTLGHYELIIKALIDDRLSTKEERININCSEIDEVTAYKTDDELIMQNENFLLAINLRNGILNIYDKYSDTPYLWQTFDELGPPFPFQGFEQTFDKEKIYAAQLIKENNKIKAIIEVDYSRYLKSGFSYEETFISDEVVFPVEYIRYRDVKIIKEITISNSSLIKIQYKFINTSVKSYKFQFRLRTKAMRSDAIIYLPTKNGVIREQTIAGEFPIAGRDLSDNPADYSQSWSAFEIDNLVFGLMWQDALLCEFGQNKMPDLVFPIELFPNSTFTLSPLYIYCGFGNYEVIKYYYEKIFENKEKYEKVTTTPLLNLYPKETIILTKDEVEFELNLENIRNKPILGNLKLTVEEGFKLSQDDFVVGVNKDKPFSERIKLKTTTKKELGVYKIDALLQTELRDYNFQLPIIVAADESKKIEINTKEEENMKIIEIDNGCILLRCCPEFSGSVIGLCKDKKNHLISAFPTKIAFGWLSPWAGGIQPFFMRELTFPTKLYEEEFTYELIKNGNYQGIKLLTQLKNPDYKGVKVSISYLTLPGSNIITIIQEAENNTPYYNELFAGIGIFLQVGQDEFQDTILYFKRVDKLITRKRTIYNAWAASETFAAVENKKTNDILGIINQSKEARIICADLGLIGKHLFIGTQLKLTPGEKKQFTSFLVIKDNIDNLLPYESALKHFILSTK